MKKAVLVIDMPENCGKCPLNYDTLECIVGDAEDKLIDTDYQDRPERCQLKPLVEAIPIEWISAKVKHHFEQESYQTASAFQWLIDIWYTEKEDWEKENAGS